MPLGAQPAGLFGLIVREGTLLVAIGVALGFAAWLAATRFVAALPFDVAARTRPCSPP